MLLAKCPHYGIPLWMQVQTFYNGLLLSTLIMVDVAIGVSLNNKHYSSLGSFLRLCLATTSRGPVTELRRGESWRLTLQMLYLYRFKSS